MSKFKNIPILNILAPQKVPALPAPEIPAPPAPDAVTSGGADVRIGTSADIKNQRVSGRTKSSSSKGTDVLGGLTRTSGLHI